MDWFHCNRCFRRKGQQFAVSSCGHICCEGCINPKQCNICGASCNYLPITDEMKPQEKVFFKDPVKLIQSRLEHIAQIALFQRTQKERVTAYFKHKSVELERRLKEVTEQGYRQISELKRENAELKKPLSQRRVSPGQFQTNGAQRMSLPVAVTSPVTPRSRITQAQLNPRGGLETEVRDSPSQTPHQTPNIFHLQFLSGSSLQSPRPLRNGH
ncbi:E3 ubiquitin-protein ligase RNF212B-like [Centroberyx affinis]|uniref:E3 ubiquitin-protein ligase RNF212B-like n=1 Tax=Centroberyx affinis TaxID=166261 RepID=UPI003A5C0D45